MSKENEHKESSVIPAILVFGLLACGAVILRMTGLVDGSGLVNLLSMSCLFGLAIFFRRQLKSIGPSGLELYKAVQEARDAESSVKLLAAATLELIVSNENGYKRPSGDHERYEKAKDNLKKLVESFDISKSQTKNLSITGE